MSATLPRSERLPAVATLLHWRPQLSTERLIILTSVFFALACNGLFWHSAMASHPGSLRYALSLFLLVTAAILVVPPLMKRRQALLDSARHCKLYQGWLAPAPFSLARFTRQWPVQGLNITSYPGVFSHGRLDRGSALLLDNLDQLPQGHVLDFGCGAGVLGAAIKRRYPHSRVTLLDVDAFAVASSRLTLAANGLQAEVISGDGIDAAPTGLSAILSNPPFHQGVHTHYQATEHLLRQASRHLQAKGELRLVANSFLKYPPLIEQHLGPCQTLADAKGFRIYRAVKN